MPIDNRKKKAKDFFHTERVQCSNCFSDADTKILDGQGDTFLCDDCLDMTLEQLAWKDDFFTNTHNKNGDSNGN